MLQPSLSGHTSHCFFGGELLTLAWESHPLLADIWQGLSLVVTWLSSHYLVYFCVYSDSSYPGLPGISKHRVLSTYTRISVGTTWRKPYHWQLYQTRLLHRDPWLGTDPYCNVFILFLFLNYSIYLNKNNTYTTVHPFLPMLPLSISSKHQVAVMF